MNLTILIDTIRVPFYHQFEANEITFGNLKLYTSTVWTGPGVIAIYLVIKDSRSNLLPLYYSLLVIIVALVGCLPW